MADEKSIVKMNKMIHKKTRASFLVVYVIYVSFVYTDSKITASCLLPRHNIFATFGRQLKCLRVRIQGGLYLFHYVLDNLNWLLFVCKRSLQNIDTQFIYQHFFTAPKLECSSYTINSPSDFSKWFYSFLLKLCSEAGKLSCVTTREKNIHIVPFIFL